MQHHPYRAKVAAELLAELDDDTVDLVTDPDPDNQWPSPWRTYRHCLETTPDWATHRAVLQDDVLACPKLPTAVANACAARPDRLISLYVGGNMRLGAARVIHAAREGKSWADLAQFSWVPAVALVWPVGMIAPFLSWVDQRGWPPTFRADDEIIGRWLRKTGHIPCATVPSLVDHPDDVPSLIGTRHRGGRDRGRVSVCWIGDCPADEIDWG